MLVCLFYSVFRILFVIQSFTFSSFLYFTLFFHFFVCLSAFLLIIDMKMCGSDLQSVLCKNWRVVLSFFSFSLSPPLFFCSISLFLTLSLSLSLSLNLFLPLTLSISQSTPSISLSFSLSLPGKRTWGPELSFLGFSWPPPPASFSLRSRLSSDWLTPGPP